MDNRVGHYWPLTKYWIALPNDIARRIIDEFAQSAATVIRKFYLMFKFRKDYLNFEESYPPGEKWEAAPWFGYARRGRLHWGQSSLRNNRQIMAWEKRYYDWPSFPGQNRDHHGFLIFNHPWFDRGQGPRNADGSVMQL